MSFWQTSEGTRATGEVQENNFDPLPKGWYTAMFESVEVDTYNNPNTNVTEKKVKIKARIVGEGTGKNRVLFLNLKVFEFEGLKASARDKALNMFVKICQITKAKMKDEEPDDVALAQLADKPLDIYVEVWDMNGKSGNHMTNVAAKGEKAGTAVAGKAAPNRNAPPADDPRFADAPF